MACMHRLRAVDCRSGILTCAILQVNVIQHKTEEGRRLHVWSELATTRQEEAITWLLITTWYSVSEPEQATLHVQAIASQVTGHRHLMG